MSLLDKIASLENIEADAPPPERKQVKKKRVVKNDPARSAEYKAVSEGANSWKLTSETRTNCGSRRCRKCYAGGVKLDAKPHRSRSFFRYNPETGDRQRMTVYVDIWPERLPTVDFMKRLNDRYADSAEKPTKQDLMELMSESYE